MAGERILVVDDEKSMCQFLSIMLRKEGYEITTVGNGKKAVEEVAGSKFDVVLTDIKMAGMDGMEVLREIKRLDPTMPVVIMTAYASQKTAIEAVNQGAFHYLIKHAKNDEIKMVVRNALDMKRVRTENAAPKFVWSFPPCSARKRSTSAQSRGSRRRRSARSLASQAMANPRSGASRRPRPALQTPARAPRRNPPGADRARPRNGGTPA